MTSDTTSSIQTGNTIQIQLLCFSIQKSLQYIFKQYCKLYNYIMSHNTSQQGYFSLLNFIELFFGYLDSGSLSHKWHMCILLDSYLGESVHQRFVPEDLQHAGTYWTTGSWKEMRGGRTCIILLWPPETLWSCQKENPIKKTVWWSLQDSL